MGSQRQSYVQQGRPRSLLCRTRMGGKQPAELQFKRLGTRGSPCAKGHGARHAQCACNSNVVPEMGCDSLAVLLHVLFNLLVVCSGFGPDWKGCLVNGLAAAWHGRAWRRHVAAASSGPDACSRALLLNGFTLAECQSCFWSATHRRRHSLCCCLC
jgi:hypothetical protein